MLGLIFARASVILLMPGNSRKGETNRDGGDPLRAIEQELHVLAELRAIAKTDGGRLTEFRTQFVAAAKTNGIKQKIIANILDLSPDAISLQYGEEHVDK